MHRRRFLQGCSVLGALDPVALQAIAAAAPRSYARARLVDANGAPVRSRALAAGTNYLFHYPFAATPCFLLNLGREVVPVGRVAGQAGGYAWQGGVGPQRSIVAFSAICAHKLAYPTREISFIRYQARRTATGDAGVIHCCADHSIYDPAAGAGVIKGPAEAPLAAILLEHDPARDELHAVGTQGPEQFAAFFRKYEFKLAMEYGTGRAAAPVDTQAVVRPMSQYCRQTVEC